MMSAWVGKCSTLPPDADPLTGCEAQFYRNEEFVESRNFTPSAGHPRTLAIAWATSERTEGRESGSVDGVSAVRP